MEEKKQENIEPLKEADLKEEIPHELFAERKEDIKAINKKVHDGGEPELPPPLDDLEEIPSRPD